MTQDLLIQYMFKGKEIWYLFFYYYKRNKIPKKIQSWFKIGLFTNHLKIYNFFKKSLLYKCIDNSNEFLVKLLHIYIWIFL